MINFIYPVLGYLIGSIPFGLVLAKLFGYGDIRAIGSGNIGATNVLRTGNKKLAILTLFFDISKGAVPVWLSFASGDIRIIFATALLAILGHMYPVWLRFKGGKGVATTLGVVLALNPTLGILMLVIWLMAAVVFRFSSLAALVSFALAPVMCVLLFSDLNLAVLTAVIAALVFWKHRANIARLRQGAEPRISFKKA